MSARAVEGAIRDRLGLDPAALGPNAIERAVEARMRARELTDPALYAARLLTEPAERNALAADLVVSETWFFRGGRALFERLAGLVADRAAARPPGTPVRVLSAPCSTGEEPYSLAIALSERLLTPDDYIIDAVDVSDPALARARAARYSAFAFREPGPDVRLGYFRPAEGVWELLPHLRAGVRFVSGNLTDPLFLADGRAYDLILCRNLFIYLTPEARLRVLEKFDRLLAPDGRLCVTPAEADRLLPERFVPAGPPETALYQRAGGAARTAAPTSSELSAEPETPPTPASPDLLGTARRLADAGRLDDARAACEALIRTRPADAEALALLGVVHLAAGRPGEAFDTFRKVLYLAPDHAEALAHMMALCERRGDAAAAAALRRRLARLVAAAPAEGP